MLGSRRSGRLSFLALSLLVFAVGALAPSQGWAQTRSWISLANGGGFDQAGCPHCETSYLGVRDTVRGRQSLTADAAGNVYVTGTSSNGSDLDYRTVKYDSAGVQQWAVSYNGGDTDRAYGVAVDASGNVYVTGESVFETVFGPQPRFLTVKYNAAGIQQWTATYDRGVWGVGTAVAVDASGNVYVTGEWYSDSDFVSITTIKYNASGVRQWVRSTFGGFDAEESSPYDLALDASGNVYVTGFLYKPLDGASDSRDYVTAKITSAGTAAWTRAHDSGGEDEAYNLALDTAGNVYVTGTSGTVKYDAVGAPQWVAPFSGVAHAVISGGAEGGSLYVAGTSGGNVRTARYDAASGAQSWATSWDGGGTDAAYALRLVSGRIYAAGTRGAAAGFDALAVGFDAATGAAAWSDTYDGGGDDFAYAMAFTGTSDFWVAGHSVNAGSEDFLTIEYTLASGGPALLGLSLTPATIAGACKTSTGKVTLDGPAPAGGVVVALSNTNPAAMVPASVTVPAGAASARFTITGTAVSTVQTGTVTAAYGGASRSATLKVRPIGVTMLTLSASSVTGPSTVSATVTLECPAAPGPVVVTLSSSNPSAAQPAVATVTIPAGASVGTFEIAARDVAAVSYATIKAVAAGVAKTVRLQVNP